jgi:hypothetical protein
MKLAQDQVGAYDFLLTPSSQSANPTARSIFINTTMIRSKLSILSEVAGVAARWLVRGNITSVADGTTGGLAATATIILFDSEYERSIGLAPLWPYRTLGSTEAHASGSLLRALRVRPENGEEIDISFDLVRFTSFLLMFWMTICREVY